MVIDLAAHILPAGYYKRLQEVAPSGFYLEKRILGTPELVDMNARMRLIDRFSVHGYRQVLSVANPPIETICGPAQAAELCRVLNEELAELSTREPDAFPTALGYLPLLDLDAAIAEIEHLVEIGLPGFEIYTNVAGRPLDDPVIFPILQAASDHGLMMFLHPARGPEHADYPVEDRSRFEVWQVLGWPYETSVAMVRLALAGLFEGEQQPVVMAHHLGGMIPFFASRITHGYAQLGTRTDDGKGPILPIDVVERRIQHLQRFYCDTAVNGGPAAIECAVDYFGASHLLFGSDMPFDSAGGVVYVGESLRALTEAKISQSARNAIGSDNACRLLRISPVVHAPR